ncbi:hypothetical protein GCM10022212_01460 [Actimicrobium antarcticum]|uniref:histidine kinase n=1 Tax=Actimicrobium antarcticum TaxID=1051899 RepID=A0ABP7SHG7_9BURK
MIGIALLVALMLFTIGLPYRSTRAFEEQANSISRTHEVMALTSGVMLALLDAETGQRGFLLTGNDEFLRPYDAAVLRLDAILAKLKEKTKDNPAQLSRSKTLVALSAARLASLNQGVVLRRQNPQEASAFIAAGSGKLQMDAIRQHAADMEKVERDLLDLRERTFAASYQGIVTMTLAAGALSLLTVGVLVWVLRRRTLRLRLSEQFNRSLMDGTTDCVKVLDLDGRLLYMNNPGLSAMEIGDFTSMYKREWEALWPAEAQADIERSVTRAAGGEVSSFDAYCPTDSGTPKWWAVTVSPVQDGEGGRVVRVLSVSRDVTERRRAEDAVRDNQLFARQVLDNLIAFVGVLTVDGTLIDLNRAPLEVAGISASDVLGKNFWDCYWWSYSTDVQLQLRGACERAAAGEVVRYDVPVRMAAEAPLWIDFQLSPLRDTEGRITHLIASGMDISERRAATTKLLESEERLRAATAAVSELIWTNSSDGLMNADQPGWSEFTGQSPQEYRGYGWSNAVHPDDAPQTIVAWNLAVAEKRPFVFEHRVRRRDGAWRLCSVRALPIFNPDGGIREWVGVHADITDRKRDEEKLRQLAADLSEAGHRKDEFLATLAHELRNPMAPLLNGLQLIKLAGGNLATIERVRSLMERQLTQMVRLVDDLMDVNRISQGKLELRKERLSLATALDSALEATRPLIGQMDQTLTVIFPEEPLILDADMTRLAQVFLNLLNNAAKYTERGGHIQLNVERDGSDAVVVVKDSGIGIAAEQLPRIFRMFAQVDQSLGKSQGGLGIGLSLVKRLVDMHGGSVEARSDGLGQGSEFIVRLPLMTDAQRPQLARASDAPAAAMPSLRILVVDDNRDSANSMTALLEIMGNDIRTAYDGQEGVDMAEAYRPDAILLDIGLPKLNGYEACRRIREQPWGKRAMLIALTGWGQDEDRQLSHEAGFDHHLVKPVDLQALITILAGVNAAPATS